MYRCVVPKSACPARAWSAPGATPAAAAFVIDVCLPSWNGRTSIVAALATTPTTTACSATEEVADEERAWVEQARVVFAVVYGLGLRRGEVLGLRWRHVRLADVSALLGPFTAPTPPHADLSRSFTSA